MSHIKYLCFSCYYYYCQRLVNNLYCLHLGNYGYSVDKNIVAQTSTTHPAYPIYDGCNYSYMPWHQRKPLIIIESSWEDCQYRMESLNLLTNIMDRLV